MIDYSKLPTEILTIIFEYLDPDRVITSTKKNIIQCQHTCKSWAVVAKTNLYQKIGIQYNSNAANLFFNTLLEHNLGYLVKSITIYGLKKKHNNRILLSNLVSQIGDLCPNLKNFSVKYPFISVDFWKCIQSERSKGAFSKLQVATIPLCFRKNKVNQYYKAAYSLKDTLIELRILPRVPIENLESFKNINTLYFPIDNSNEIYKIDQHIKVCPSVKFININPTGNTKVYPLNNDINGSSVNICPQVRQLLVKDIQFDNELFGYVMNVFPNLNELNIRFKTKSLPKRLNKTSNEIALQFLSYLMKIPNASVNIFPVEDVESLLKNFQDISGINRNLSITYQKNTTIPNSLTLSTNRRGINILVNSSNNEYLNLPRIGMIEKSGKRLQSITLNMGINYKHMNDLNGMDALNNGIDVYPIFLYCPNLKSIHILHTPLCFLDTLICQAPSSTAFIIVYLIL
ncbi:hypothetical protein BD770DRAFT_456705 [Pilaira anomala]|nr:hypothetical protein BD770DRAFT_456705 [Pilaira anomala]